jgi:hypothetical protein
MAAAYEVVNVAEDQIPDPSGSGELVDVFAITYTLPGRSGQFTLSIPESGDPVTDAHNAILTKVAEINAIYAGG